MAFSHIGEEKFEASGLWPDDGVIVSEEEHKKLFTDIPPGKQIGTLNGKPALIDIFLSRPKRN